MSLYGICCGSAVGLARRAAGRGPWGAVPFMVAIVAAALVADRSDWPQWGPAVVTGLLLIVLAAAGACRLLADPAIHWAWLAAGVLISAAGVWAGVPETGPAVLVGAGFVGLVASTALTRADWAPTAGLGLAALLGWAALSGAVGRPWAAIGGALCTGMAPWWALRPLLPTLSWSRWVGRWLLGAHVLLVVVAARWIGVDPDPGWQKLVVISIVGLFVAMSVREQP